MRKTHTVSFAGVNFHAHSGQTLLDAALMQGVEMPHDCRSGRCGACLTHIRAGITIGGESRQAGVVHACQAHVFSDLSIEVEPLPPVVRTNGEVVDLRWLASDIVEPTIAPSAEFEMYPGQYCKFRFRGFPVRAFSPTAPLDGASPAGTIRLHIRQIEGGRVSPQLGHAITKGHAVSIDGPFGHAFLRMGDTRRLVLVGSGTGFAPMWAVAAAALRENATRSVVLMAATRTLPSFYMGPALSLACRFPNVQVIGAVDAIGNAVGAIQPGSPLTYLPRLCSDDLVYSAGAPALVDAVGDAAQAAGATFYADPFAPSGTTRRAWLETARSWLMTG
jgi:3-phenylpropionate/trans-cinnamate dioxygenase ferredoxin reductase subunit